MRWLRIGLILWMSAVLAAVAAHAEDEAPAPPKLTGTFTRGAVTYKRAKWKFGKVDGWKLTTEHYAIHTTIQDEDTLARIPLCLETLWGELGKLLPPQKLAEKLKVYDFANREEWAKFTESFAGKMKDMFLSLQFGGYCHEFTVVTWNMGSHFSNLSHEACHQYFYKAYGLGVPPSTWLDEGFATLWENITWAEDGNSLTYDLTANGQREPLLKSEYLAGKLWPIAELAAIDSKKLLASDGHAFDRYYSQSWGLLSAMLADPEWRKSFQALCDAYHQFKPKVQADVSGGPARLLKQVFPDARLDALQAHFEQFLKTRYAAEEPAENE